MRAPYLLPTFYEDRPQSLGNCVALVFTLLGRKEIDLNISLIRHAPHVVVAHKPVEVVRTGSAGVELVIENIRLTRKFVSKQLGYGQGLLQRRAVRHIDNHLQFAFVVERKHLHANQSQGDKHDRNQQKREDRGEE